jgi:hypothetical protein
LKDPKKTNPSSEKSKHQICKALFYATTPWFRSKIIIFYLLLHF